MLRKSLVILSMGIIISAISFSCTRQLPDEEERTKPVLDPENERNPPIAKNVFIQKLKEPTRAGNMLLTAEFEKGVVKESFLVINDGEKQVTLLDNGKGGDEKRGDGVFSLILQENEDQLIERFKAINESSEGQRRLIRFVNRTAVEPSKNEADFLIDIENFQRGQRIKIFPVFPALPPPDPLLKSHSLMVRDLIVVEDPVRTFSPCDPSSNPSGVWTFWESMRQMASPNPGSIANDLQTSAFIMSWLNTWNMSLTVNGENLPARNNIQSSIISPWLQKSQNDGAPFGVLLKEWSPFRLTAIVNRVDLRGNSGYGFSGAGEGRFVFTAIDISPSTPTCNALGNGFNVILEYGINKRSCADVKAYGQEWHDLKNLPLGSPAYLTALENITLQFSKCGTHPSKPNQNSINQVRTNEIALSSPWELREFNLFASGGLKLVTVKQEPAVKYNAQTNNPDVALLADYINSNQLAVENGNYTVPLTHNGQDFLGGKSHTPSPSHFWDGDRPPPPPAAVHIINSDKARHIFSLTTCSGCHGGETKTFFTMVGTVGQGTVAPLAGFLTGLGPDDNPGDNDLDPTGLFFVSDAAGRPSGAPLLRGFNDLERRAQDLDNLINKTCGFIGSISLARSLTFAPLNMPH